MLGNGLGRSSGDVSQHAAGRAMQYPTLLLQALDEQYV